MMERDASKKLVGLMQEIGTKLDSAAGIIKKSGEEEEHQTYLATIEFVLGYLRQDVMQPIFTDYPDLAPDDWEHG